MHAAFLAAVIADPHSDAPRLVYADWLDERPDDASRDRAAFIRGQCAIAASPPDSLARLTLECECARLLQRHWDAWSAGVFAAMGPAPWWRQRGHRVEFRRGFPDSVTIEAERYVAGHAAMHAAAPITQVAISAGYDDAMPRVMACPTVARLDTLAFRGFPGPDPFDGDDEPAALEPIPLAWPPVAVAVSMTRDGCGPAVRLALTCDRSPGRPIRVVFELPCAAEDEDVSALLADLLGRISTDRLATVTVLAPRCRASGWDDVVARLPPETALVVDGDRIPPA